MASVLRGQEQGASPREDAGNIVRGRWGERMEAEQAVHNANRSLYPNLYAVSVTELQKTSHDAPEDLRPMIGARTMITPQTSDVSPAQEEISQGGVEESTGGLDQEAIRRYIDTINSPGNLN